MTIEAEAEITATLSAASDVTVECLGGREFDAALDADDDAEAASIILEALCDAGFMLVREDTA
jgi:hypothetical protein